MHHRSLLCVVLLFAAFAAAAGAAPVIAPLDEMTINNATLKNAGPKRRAVLIRAEVMLDRANFSPGAIDGEDGDNFRKAIAAYQAENGLDASGVLDRATFERLVGSSSAPAMRTYEISEEDERVPFEKHIPTSFEAMAKLPALSYTGPRQELAERFHMSEKLLAALNPQTDFRHAGTRITVANVETRAPGKVAKVVIDKANRSLSAFDDRGRLVAFYPASIGSKEKPAPSGVFKVLSVTRNPAYYYNPEFAFKGVKVNHEFKIAPGPNNPVGLAWIDLSAPSYGIHGTPAPERIGKTESHGCIRLTNWDALDLASRVRRGTIVDLVAAVAGNPGRAPGAASPHFSSDREARAQASPWRASSSDR
jgi:lipoprotein-anchoring transpeptidase ErfK/SrfK